MAPTFLIDVAMCSAPKIILNGLVRRIVRWFSFVLIVLSISIEEVASQPPILEVNLQSEVVRGLPVHWGSQDALLLRKDGSLRFLEMAQIAGHRITKEPFAPFGAMQLRGMLQEEFGRSYEVQGVGNYLMVAPTGTAGFWADRFQELSDSFVRFFTTRGFPLRDPDFPLVAVVVRNQQELSEIAGREGSALPPMTLGYYSSITNRMNLFDRPPVGGNWYSTQTTVLHEATHQLAFNMGIHQRLSSTPLFVVEGLASLFEAPGYTDSSSSGASQKVNEGRLETWRRILSRPDRATQLLSKLIEEDRSFEETPDESYAVAWGVSFYLSEREPNKYMNYLKHLASLPPYQPYPRPQRAGDFRRMIGADLSLLIRNIDRYLASL